MGWNDTVPFSTLVGKTLTAVIVVDNDHIQFVCSDGTAYRQYHEQDCCESVQGEDMCGVWEDIIGSPILVAEESTNHGDTGHYESQTWTFYKIDTIKGGVTIRWLGVSNGYYSESVSFELMDYCPEVTRN